MISKRSFIKLLRDDSKKRSWLWILAFLGFCVFFPGIVLDNVQGMVSMYGNKELGPRFLAAVTYSGNIYYLGAVCLMAMACALSGFSYIHSKSKLDFYHSLPVKRETWLALQFTSSILMFAVPTAFQAVIEFFMGMVYNVLNREVILAVAGSYLLYLLIFLAAYFICVLAMLMTGKLLVSFLLMPALFGFSGAVEWIHRTFKSTFYQGYLPIESSRVFEKYPALITLMKDLVDQWNLYVERGLEGSFPGRECLGLLIFSLALVFINSWLYRNRKTESAGCAVVFPKLAMLIQLLAAVAASLGVGICLKNFSYTRSDVWFFGGMGIGVVVFTAMIDFLYCSDIRGVLKKPLQLCVIALVTFSIALTFRFDLLGFDTFLPKKEQIASMSVDNYALCNVYRQTFTLSFQDSSSTVDYNSMNILNSYQMTEFEPIYAMAENGRDNVGKEVGSSEDDLMLVNVRFDLNSGRSVYRSYWVDTEVFQENAAKLYEKPGFIKAMYPIFSRNSRRMSDIWGVGMDMGSRHYHFESEEEKTEFLEAYKADLLTLRYEELTNGEIIGNLSISYGTPSDLTENNLLSLDSVTDEDEGYPILKRFTSTLAVLEKFGITFSDTLDPDQVGELSVWYGDSENTVELLAVEAGQTDLITDAQKRELLSMLTYQYCSAASFTDELYYITAYGVSGEYLQTFTVPREDLPEDILEILEENR